MEDQSTSWLGECPECERLIPSRSLLIEYTTSKGWVRLYAECPECSSVVHPA
ncbi:MAG: hypothetical protein V5A46_00260 [Haloferacaceae archaeon]